MFIFLCEMNGGECSDRIRGVTYIVFRNRDLYGFLDKMNM